MSKAYQLPDQRVLFAGPGIGGESYMAFWRKTGKPGSHRLVSKALPIRKSIEEAEADLAAFAAKHRLTEVAS